VSINEHPLAISEQTRKMLLSDVALWLDHDSAAGRSHALMDGRHGAELATAYFYLSDNPDKPLGSGGEKNYCKVSFFLDHANIKFATEQDDKCCVFCDSIKWEDLDKRILQNLQGLIANYISIMYNMRNEGNSEYMLRLEIILGKIRENLHS